MEFKEALRILDIEEYGERIFNSNSHGELSHLSQYITLAEGLEKPSLFKSWFEAVVKLAEEHWKRPESIYQHILRVFEEDLRK